MSKAVRNIILIDEALCDGCGDCITACAEGALEIIDSKARLKGAKFCDGVGACLGHCPTGALTVERREVEEFDEIARQEKTMRREKEAGMTLQDNAYAGCPGSAVRQFTKPIGLPKSSPCEGIEKCVSPASTLTQWPVQLHLVPPKATFLLHADLLITADCVPFAYADYHHDFLHGRKVLVGCPKLDDLQAYVGKLTEIFATAELRSVEVLLMEVPCCGGLAQAVRIAKLQAGAKFDLKVTIIGVRGENMGTSAA